MRQSARVTSNPAIRAVLYLRVSLDRTGEHLAVSRQREDCQRIAADRGWRIVEEFVDNSTSASKRTVRRPGYDQMVSAYNEGKFDALICWDLDRLTRQPRQLEDWIDAATDRGLLLVTANGEADLSTDAGRLFARIKASVARSEVERKSARQIRAASQRAELGKPPGGPRLTGYTSAGEIVDGEAELVTDLFHRFASGESLRELATALNGSGRTARSGRPWNPSTVRTILVNPRYAGLAVYRGETNGRPGNWPPIIDEATFSLVNSRLADPRRRTQVGTDRKHLGAGLFLCGECGKRVRSHTGNRYRCPSACITRMQGAINEYVLGVVRARLAMPDLADSLTTANPEAMADWSRRATELRARLTAISDDYDAGLIDGHRFKVATEKVSSELAALEAAHVRSAAGLAVAGALAAADPVAAFDDSPLGIQREILSFFATVLLHPAPRGKRFDPADGSVEIQWRSS